MSDVAPGKKTRRDLYSNIALPSVTLSAANTLTFSQLQMGIGLFAGQALLLHRVLWFPNVATVREIVAATDSLYMALTVSNRLAGIADVTDPSVIALQAVVGVGANVESVKTPLVSDFTQLPGGGKLIPANPLFLAGYSLGFAAAAVIRAQLDFSFVQLGDADYLELLQSMYPITV